jgi:UDP-N-acetylmuramoylalanine--D-glutamate ligase
MNQKLTLWKEQIKRKEVAVLGVGISHRPLIEYLVKLGAHVTACDRRKAEELGEIYQTYSDMGVAFQLGENYLDNLTQEMIFKTPGMRFDLPQLIEARKQGTSVVSEMEVFFDLCPAQIIAVTGSDGKTTTTTLIAKMLEKQGFKTWLGGNIGHPLLTDIEKIKPEDKVVVELSSFQLHTMKSSPAVAVITNISPNHLDMHKDYQEYIDAKKNIMRYQSKDALLVVNFDNEVTREIGKEAQGKVCYFSRKTRTDGVYLENDWIIAHRKPVLNIHDIKIPGMYNVENYMAAIAAVEDMVDTETVQRVAKEFGGVEHRIELVRTLSGVRYYNSSIDSSPNRTKHTLGVFSDKVILIAGGKDKGIPYDELGPVLAEKVKVLILCGATSDYIQESLNKEIERSGNGKDIKVICAQDYPAAVRQAREHAKAGDVVVLSPASTSFDRFKNFEERGNLFKKLVMELEE